MGGGAIIAITAAAHAARLREVHDAFRLAGATAPDRAMTLEELRVVHHAEVEQLVAKGIVVAAPGRNRWYLSEAAIIAHRDAPRSQRALLIVIYALLGIGLGLLVLLVKGGNP